MTENSVQLSSGMQEAKEPVKKRLCNRCLGLVYRHKYLLEKQNEIFVASMKKNTEQILMIYRTKGTKIHTKIRKKNQLASLIWQHAVRHRSNHRKIKINTRQNSTKNLIIYFPCCNSLELQGYIEAKVIKPAHSRCYEPANIFRFQQKLLVTISATFK